MKKIIFLILFTTISTFSFSQDATTYKKGILITGGQFSSKNLGKNVTLTYDSFYDSYKIYYTDVNGTRVKMLFTSYTTYFGDKEYILSSGGSYNIEIEDFRRAEDDFTWSYGFFGPSSGINFIFKTTGNNSRDNYGACFDK